MNHDKQALRALGKSVGLDFVCTEVKKNVQRFIFSDRPDPKKYEFREFTFFAEDLTQENLAFCKAHGFSR